MDNSITSASIFHPVTGLDDETYLKLATVVATENVLRGNGGPFGAVIVTPEGRIFSKGNSVTTTNDPTAHAEVNAIRFACAELGTFDLSGCVLYSSCEPCPMCLGAALWSRVERVVFAADRYDAADAGFDDAAFYAKLAEGNVAEQLIIDNHKRPFEAWGEYTERTEY
jgi:guanine deaminase